MGSSSRRRPVQFLGILLLALLALSSVLLLVHGVVGVLEMAVSLRGAISAEDSGFLSVMLLIDGVITVLPALLTVLFAVPRRGGASGAALPRDRLAILFVGSATLFCSSVLVLLRLAVLGAAANDWAPTSYVGGGFAVALLISIGRQLTYRGVRQGLLLTVARYLVGVWVAFLGAGAGALLVSLGHLMIAGSPFADLNQLVAMLTVASCGAFAVTVRLSGRLAPAYDFAKYGVREPRRRPLRAILYGLAAISLPLAALVFGFSEGWMLLPALVSLFVAVPLWTASRRYGAKAADQVLAKDDRPPVLYLRSFAADTKHQGRFEDALVRFFTPVGPVVAIGKPGEELQSPGVSRMYVGEEWQEVVQGLMRDAALVIVQMGETDGLGWELENLVRLVPPERVFIIVKSADRPSLTPEKDLHEQYAGFREVAASQLPKPLPERLGPNAFDDLTFGPLPVATVRFLGFSADWTPEFLEAPRAPFLARLRATFGSTNQAVLLREVMRSRLEAVGVAIPKVFATAREIAQVAFSTFMATLLALVLAAAAVGLWNVVLPRL